MAFNHNSGDKNRAKTTRSKTAANNRTGKKTARNKTASIKTAATSPGQAAVEKSSSKAKKKPAVARARKEHPAMPLKPTEGEKQDPFEIAKQTMKGSVPAIVKAMVKLAKQGSCSHAKTLLEMTGAKHMFGEEAESQENGEPWAKLVLQRMEEAEHEGSEHTAR